jgi:AcrR family transcriptional regulator
MNAARTARERARAELTLEIKEEARRQLRASGAHGLSLRAVARELGMVSSALYRYFPSRDELLTALIIDAYDALGARAEAASASADPAASAGLQDFRGRWRACCTAIRGWALEHPHEYALVYGSPVPGYRAPVDTVAPAARIPAALIAPVREADQAGVLTTPQDPLSPELSEQAAKITAMLAPGLPEPAFIRFGIAWTQLFGLITFELFGHLAKGLDPADPFFTHTVDQMADFIGLPA